MIRKQKRGQSFAWHGISTKGTPTLGQELLSVLRFVFDQPEQRLKATDFVWSYQELADDVPD